MTSKIDGIYPLSQRLVDAMPGFFLKVEPHETDDPEGSDLLWIEVTAPGKDDLTEGQVILIDPAAGAEVWYAAHDSAHKYGGWPTHWDSCGSEQKVFQAVVDYLVTRKRFQ